MPEYREPKSRRTGARFVLLLGMIAVLFAACARPAARPSRIVASVPPVAALVRMVAGHELPVESFLAAGRDPHHFEPTPSQVERLRDAALLVGVGPGVDPWFDRLAGADAAAPLVRMADLVGPAEDPHLWLDPDACLALVDAVAETLAARDPSRAEVFQANRDAARARLLALDEEIRAALREVAGAPFVLHHTIFLAWVDRYGLNPVAVLERHAGGEASPRTLHDAADALRDAGGRVVFTQPELDRRAAETLAVEVEGRVAVLDPMGVNLPETNTEFPDLLLENARIFREALGAGDS